MGFRSIPTAAALGLTALLALAGCGSSAGSSDAAETTASAGAATASDTALPLDGISFDVHRDPG